MNPKNMMKNSKNGMKTICQFILEIGSKAPHKIFIDKNGKILVDNKYKRNRLQLIGTLLSKVNIVIHAGDPDEEGQN